MLLKLINSILDFSKIEAGRLELDSTPFYLHTCVEGILDLLADQAADKGVVLAYDIDDETPPALEGDVTRLRQILVNLANNAVKFTEAGEVVVLVRGEPEQDRWRLHFAVRDTGIGISKKQSVRSSRRFRRSIHLSVGATAAPGWVLPLAELYAN